MKKIPKYIVHAYIDCKRCSLCNYRRNIVFGRGSIPADILFIGEAPGKTEDLLGLAFVGPSGRLLNLGMKRACELVKYAAPEPSLSGDYPAKEFDPLPSRLAAITYFITNVVACRPTDSTGGDNRQPSPEEAWACTERVKQTIADCNPRKVIFLGDIAKKYYKRVFPQALCLQHPAYIARQGGASSPAFLSFVRELSEVFKELSNVCAG